MRISVSKICAILRAEGFSRFLLRCTLLITFLTQSIEACKLWAVCTTSGITFSNLSEESSSMIQSELTSFYHQSAMMLDGWSILGYQDSFHQETISICRSPNTAPDDSSLYWETVENLMSNEGGIIGMGHLRVATSGSNSIPNPHPWIFQIEDTVFSLMHNGTVNKDLLLNLITDSGPDSSWLEAHPPQTFGGGHWSESGWENVVDSELILMYVMKKTNLLGDDIEGFKNKTLTKCSKAKLEPILRAKNALENDFIDQVISRETSNKCQELYESTEKEILKITEKKIKFVLGSENYERYLKEKI